jgi:hypothetical protein
VPFRTRSVGNAMSFEYSSLRMIKTKTLCLSREGSWWTGPKGWGFQTYRWPERSTDSPQIAVGACSHGTRVALWAWGYHRSWVFLAPFRTDPMKRHYWKLIKRD